MLVSLPSTLIQLVILVAMLVALHPRILNPILQRLAQAKLNQADQFEVEPLTAPPQIPQLQQYPWRPLLGEVAFVLLRGVGFIFALWRCIPSIWRMSGG